jgi:methionyl-tRNA formyltransferase
MTSQTYKIAFFGSDEISLPFLNFLNDQCPFVHVSAVLTQPDRRSGRGRKMASNAIKTWAENHSISCRSPEKPSDLEVDWLREQNIDLILVMAYGHILKKSFLTLAPAGCFNFHASILPKYRGASPIETAIAMGEENTGVTLMRVIPQMDAGPILDFESVVVEGGDTGESVRSKIADSCLPLIQRNIQGLLDGIISEKKQDHSYATYCRKINKTDGNIDFSAKASHLVDRIRAFKSWPGCGFFIDGQKIRIGSAGSRPNNALLDIGLTQIDLDGNLVIGTGEGLLIPHELQRPGGKCFKYPIF